MKTRELNTQQLSDSVATQWAHIAVFWKRTDPLWFLWTLASFTFVMMLWLVVRVSLLENQGSPVSHQGSPVSP